jgi:hypothetical protein
MSMESASIAQHCKSLHLAAIGSQFASLGEEASQHNHSHLRYLDALLSAEVEDRERRSIELRIKDAHLPRIKTLEEFDFAQSPHLPASRIRTLAEGGYLARRRVLTRSPSSSPRPNQELRQLSCWCRFLLLPFACRRKKTSSRRLLLHDLAGRPVAGPSRMRHCLWRQFRVNAYARRL